ncbi:hypothetical protein [Viscerimonas tarda]
MYLVKSLKGFIIASGKFINSKRGHTVSILDEFDLDLSLGGLVYSSVGEGRKNMGSDFMAVRNDFRKVTEQAKLKTSSKNKE